MAEEKQETLETGNEDNSNPSERQQQIVDMGSATIKTEKGTIHTLTIVGQIEGHQILPPTSKSTKYEHVMPLLAAVEESDDVDGLLVLLNTVPMPEAKKLDKMTMLSVAPLFAEAMTRVFTNGSISVLFD